MRTITPTAARRMAISRQHLAAPEDAAPAQMLDLVRELGCLQLDPISAVARSHLLVLWSRLGNYDPAHLDTLMWEARSLFEYWAHCASIVLTEDYPIHRQRMQSYGTESVWGRRFSQWVEENAELRDHILRRIELEGPLLSRDFELDARRGWKSTGWTNERSVSRMLDYLWMKGQIMVAGRSGGQKLWDLAERRLPDWTPREDLAEHELVRRAVERSLRALGVAQSSHISQHFIRGRYTNLPTTLAELEAEGRIEQVRIVEDSRTWPGKWYVHTDDLPLLERVQDKWEGRTTLLSPFDNLICDRKRTEKLFDFRFRIEIYVPKEQREFGYYVLPILHGDRLIGRLDPTMERKTGRLNVNAVYAEPDAQDDRETVHAIRDAIEDLAGFLGAREIAFSGRVPEIWSGVLGA